MSLAGKSNRLWGRPSGLNFHMGWATHALTEALPQSNLTYIVENNPDQFDWKHARVREVDFSAVCTNLGMPVCLGTARSGSLTQRLRNW